MKRITFTLLLFMTLAGCVTQKGPLLMGDVRYLTPEGMVAATPKVVVGVSPFKDERGKPASVLGVKKSTQSSLETELVVQGTGADKVTAIFKDALKARGFSVKDVAAWDMTAEGIKAEGVDVLMSGEIKSLWVETVTSILSVDLKADAQLRVVAADVPDKKILSATTVNSSLERKNIAFSFEYVQQNLSEVLSAAINQVFDDEGIKKKLK
jgi:predicted small lipoprotein YifL